MVYARQLSDGRVLDVGVSGALYRDALVLYDRETGTYWSQITGEAIRGPLAGRRLAEVPSVVTSWREWRKAHPETLLLASDPGPRQSPYADYFANSEKFGVLGTKNSDTRLPGKTWVWGFIDGSEAYAVVEERLTGEPRALTVADQTLWFSREGDRVLISPEGSVRALRTYWFVWAQYHPGSRIFPEAVVP